MTKYKSALTRAAVESRRDHIRNVNAIIARQPAGTLLLIEDDVSYRCIIRDDSPEGETILATSKNWGGETLKDWLIENSFVVLPPAAGHDIGDYQHRLHFVLPPTPDAAVVIKLRFG